ncbi:MAG: hypothetical protein ACI9Y7_000418 [Dokdonia sp.]|jgi:hypothetical protein
MLTIQLYKHTNKPTILTCIRADKSETWSKLYPNTEYHDLAHIAVEETLGFKNSFFGMVASGVNITDFELPEHQKPDVLRGANLPRESLVTEHLVNLLTIEQFNTKENINFIEETQKILKENNLPFLRNLTEGSLRIIRTKFLHLISLWKHVKDGDYLENTLNV